MGEEGVQSTSLSGEATLQGLLGAMGRHWSALRSREYHLSYRYLK